MQEISGTGNQVQIFRRDEPSRRTVLTDSAASYRDLGGLSLVLWAAIEKPKIGPSVIIGADGQIRNIGEQATRDRETNRLKEAYRAMRRGGTIVVPVQLWSIEAARNALEEVGFKQLRFLEVVRASKEEGNYPVDNRLMVISAVKGGGSTFNTLYHNGRFGSLLEPAGIVHLIRELVSIHTSHGDLIATSQPHVAAILASADFNRMEAPDPDKKAWEARQTRRSKKAA